MRLTVEKIERSKSGKSWSVKAAGGRYYTCNAPGIEQTSGKTIEAEIGSFKMPDGNERATIASFLIADETAAGPGPSSHPTPAGDGGRWWLPFVSNQTAHAIQCGMIKEPKDIYAFAVAAKNAIIRADAAEGDSNIPF